MAGRRRKLSPPTRPAHPPARETPVPIVSSIGASPTSRIAPANGGNLTETPDGATPASATLSSPANHDTHAAPTASRRQFFAVTARGAVAFGALGAGGTPGYSLWVEPMRPRVVRREFTLRGMPREMDGIRIAHLSDIHHGCWMPLEQVERVVAQANALRPDLMLLTGDYVHQSPAYIDPVARVLGELRPRIGTVAVLGNHDWWEGVGRVRQALSAAGIPLVDNGRLILTQEGRLERRADRGVCIAGIGDLWEDETDFAAALDGVPDAMPRLLMSHNPDAAEEDALARGGWRVDLMLRATRTAGRCGCRVWGIPWCRHATGRSTRAALCRDRHAPSSCPPASDWRSSPCASPRRRRSSS